MPTKIDFHSFKKFCLNCYEPLKLRNFRDIERKKFCSKKCCGAYTARTLNLKPPVYRGKNNYNWKGGVSKIKRYCEDCGKPVTYNNINNFCQTCFNKRKTNKIKFKCVICGKERSLIPHHYKNLKYKCCGDKCIELFKRKIGMSTIKMFKCPNCNKEFERQRTQTPGKLVFCSMSCSSQYYGNKYKKTCCFYIDGRTPLRILIKNSSRYYEWRDEILQRDDYRCIECNSKNNLHVHHKVHFTTIMNMFMNHYSNLDIENDKEALQELAFNYPLFWDTNNGVTLCCDCHAIHHPDISFLTLGNNIKANEEVLTYPES